MRARELANGEVNGGRLSPALPIGVALLLGGLRIEWQDGSSRGGIQVSLSLFLCTVFALPCDETSPALPFCKPMEGEMFSLLPESYPSSSSLQGFCTMSFEKSDDNAGYGVV